MTQVCMCTFTSHCAIAASYILTNLPLAMECECKCECEWYICHKTSSPMASVCEVTEYNMTWQVSTIHLVKSTTK